MKRIAAVFLFCIVAAGCNDWERTTFQSVAASKAVIDQAQVDYEARTIPHTTCAYNLINKAKAAQTTAVDALLVYEQVKAFKGNLSAQEGIVVQDISLVAPLITQIQTIGNPEICGGSK